MSDFARTNTIAFFRSLFKVSKFPNLINKITFGKKAPYFVEILGKFLYF